MRNHEYASSAISAIDGGAERDEATLGAEGSPGPYRGIHGLKAGVTQNGQQPPNAGKISSLLLCCFLLAAHADPVRAEIQIPSFPLNSGQSSPPVVMLVAGKDHKMFREAYDDRTDLDGDGIIDIRFNPRIVYYGLFDSKLCYSGFVIGRSDMFGPDKPVTDMTLHKCGGGLWSGNFLNYVTTSRMDALRRVLYGGHRSSDGPLGGVVLRRAYIPRDAHGWGKEYTSLAVDGYNIADYTPYSVPTVGRRHFFGNYTVFTDCTKASTCREADPVLHVAVNASGRIWDWAGSEGDVLFSDTRVGATSNDRYKVQVLACWNAFTLPDGTTNYRGENCRPYTDSKGKTLFRPAGVLHKFGEDGSILFGLITGSYDTNVSGGILRKTVSSFADEVDLETGAFTANNTIVKTFDNMMIRGFMGYGQQRYANYLSYGYGSWIGHRVMLEREFSDWGNPIGEMMYEALRYLSGADTATSEFQTSTTDNDSAVGLPRAKWDKPYSRLPWCSRPNLLVLSDINPSYDSDQLPGARFQSCSRSGSLPSQTVTTTSTCVTSTSTNFTDSFGSLNVGKLVDEIGQKEGINGKTFFIGQSGSLADWAPTAKTVTSLSTIRGLAPEEPGKEGSYNSAGVAYYGKTVGIPTVAGKNNQKVDTWVIALASPLPKIEVPTPRGTITIVPFGKSVSSNDINIRVYPERTNFQPGNQIVDFFVTAPPSGTGLYDAKFLVSFEDMEQGADFDMDVIVEYHVQQQANGNVTVTLTPKYMAADLLLNIGYVVSGAGAQDGAYLVVQNRKQTTDSTSYYLNVPDGKPVGYCNNSKSLECAALPACSNGSYGECTLGAFSTRTFTPSSTGSAATLLKDPLWYAAKWGGFRDTDAKHWPDTPKKWDADGDGQPDTYFSVRNALALEKALTTALNAIQEGADKSSGKIDTNNDTFGSSETLVFIPTLHVTSNPPDWSGDLVARVITPIDKNNPTGLGPVRWHAAEKILAADKRRIFTRSNSSLQDIPSQGVEFRWDKLNPDQQAALTFGNRFNGSEVLNYVRGSASKEITNSGSFRDRYRAGGAASPLGDSPNNGPHYFKPTNTVYIGANDGMLHAFDATTGQELFAYIPSALIPKLPELATFNYSHAWYVDGEAAFGTVKDDASNVTHMLVGTLGRGGKGLFGLNVTDPANFSADNVAWEFNGIPGEQCGANPDRDNLGLILGKPFIGTLNDGKTYALVGNGYNSCTGKAALYIIDIQTGQVVRRIDTPIEGNNGLSTPVGLDINGDGSIDLVWAGDLLGNLWRFDLRSDSPAGWDVRFGSSNTPMFTARTSKGEAQPITAPPAVTLYSSGAGNALTPFVFFGTGRYLTLADKAGTGQIVQSWYGLIDDSDTGLNTITRNQLAGRKFVSAGTATLSNGKETVTRNVSLANANDMVNKRGWFIDFDFKGDEGERVVGAPLIIKVQRGTVVEIPSIIPNSDPCMAGGRSYRNSVSAFSGAAIDFPFTDLNGDGVVDDKDIFGGPGGATGSIDLQNGMSGNMIQVGDHLYSSGTGGEIDGQNLPPPDGGSSRYRGRVSWREIIQSK
jgi:type IV pilus assembly protein PilY1